MADEENPNLPAETGLRPLVVTYLAILGLLVPSFITTFFNLGFGNPLANLLIAAVQAVLIMSVFMKLRWSSPLVRIGAALGFFFVLIMATLILSDFLFRAMT